MAIRLVQSLRHAVFNPGEYIAEILGQRRRLFGRFLLDLALWLLMIRIIIICIARVKQVSYGVALLNFVLPALPFWILYLVL